VGLDEVLSATSIEGLMRFAPARAQGGQPFVFVPERSGRQRDKASHR
jgi:hypothetical protein